MVKHTDSQIARTGRFGDNLLWIGINVAEPC